MSICKHPNIVSLFCTFSDPNHLYYVLELCPNGELLTWLKKFGNFDLNTVRFYTAEIALALEFLHKHNIIHRDLKPENLLLTASMHLKLTDFGTSKELEGSDTLARSNSFVGTAEYVCPELLSIKETSAASDLWALGAIVYQLITGRMPFHGATQYLTFQNVLNRQFSYPQQPFDAHARDLVDGLLALEPAKRLGAAGYEPLKAHPFFAGLDWASLHETAPPAMAASEVAWTWEADARSPASSADEPGGGEGEREAGPSSSGAPEGVAYDAQATETFKKHLVKDERVLRCGIIWKRRRISVRKRHLLLTTTPRLIYIDPATDETKGEIPLSPETKIEVKSKKAFIIHTPGRKYILEDANKNASLWNNAIKIQISKLSS